MHPAWSRWRFTHISDDLLPGLRAAGVSGVSGVDMTTMLVENPRRVLDRPG
jgi:predicted metal-dependent phosphotriesterase family hydrolase